MALSTEMRRRHIGEASRGRGAAGGSGAFGPAGIRVA